MRIKKDRKKSFLQTTLVFTLVATIVGAFIGSGFTYLLPKVFDKHEYSLKATICTPSSISAEFVNNETGDRTPIEVGLPAPLFISFENTGKNPLNGIDLYIEFTTDKKDFQLQAESYHTEPAKGFGKVDIVKPNEFMRIIKIPLFNPGEKIVYSAYGNYPVKTTTYSKKYGLSFYSEMAPSCAF